jgi:flagellar biogenesis protein FliO
MVDAVHRQKAVSMPLPDLLSAFGALALVLGLIVLLRFGTRFVSTMRPNGAASPFRLVGQLGLDGRRRLQLVQCGTGQVLLLTGGSSDVMLAWPPQGGPTP